MDRGVKFSSQLERVRNVEGSSSYMGYSNRLPKIAAVLALTASLLLTACGGAGNQPKAEAKPADKAPSGTVVFANNGDVKILNPLLVGDVYSSSVTDRIFDGLINVDDHAQPKAGLADTWKISDDGKTYTFNLRHDVKWHDGQAFTAKDVVFTQNAILHPEYTGPRRDALTDVAGVAQMDAKVEKLDAKAADYSAQVQKIWEDWKNTGSIKATDDYTVVIQLDHVSAPFMINAASLPILPEHLYKGTEGKKMDESPYNQKPVGTGAMKFVEWIKGDHVTLETNTDWRWGLFHHPYQIKTFQYKAMPSAQAAMAALQNGEVDMAELDADNWDKFTKLPTIDTTQFAGWDYLYIGYNFNVPELQDKRVRQALTMSVDRQSLIDNLYKGHATIANTHGAPGRWDYNENVKKWNFDPAAAGKLLDDAGWKLNPATGIREQDGKPLSLTYTYTTGSKTRESVAAFVLQSWKKAGIDAKISGITRGALQQQMKAPPGDKIQAWGLGWSAGTEPDSYEIFHSKGGFSWMGHYKNAEIDSLYEQGRQVVDVAKRKELYTKAQEILAEEQPYTWICYVSKLYGTAKRVKGFHPAAAAGLFWNMEEWTADGN